MDPETDRRDPALLVARTRRWRWPWAILGTVLALGLSIGFLLLFWFTPRFIAGRWGVVWPEPALDLKPGRPDTFLDFAGYGLALMVATGLTLRVVHGWSPRLLLGTLGRFPMGELAKATLATIIADIAATLAQVLVFPGAISAQTLAPHYGLWFALALAVIFVQAMGEEVLFKGYLLRAWGAVLPFRWLALALVCATFVLPHLPNDDLKTDAKFNVIFFTLWAMLTFVIYLRQGSVAATTGIHWVHNVWAFAVVATEPGQSGALSLWVFRDPVLLAGGSYLTLWWAYPMALIEPGLVAALLLWPRSPLYLAPGPVAVPAHESTGPAPPPAPPPAAEPPADPAAAPAPAPVPPPSA